VEKHRKTRLAIGIVGIAAMLVVGLGHAQRKLAPTRREVTGTLTRVDPGARTISLEVVHPRNGQMLEVTGQVPDACEIRIGERSASLAELLVGERVTAEGLLYSDGRAVALRLEAAGEVSSRAQRPEGEPAPGQDPPTTEQ